MGCKIMQYGEENCWLRWNLSRWGTKWDAYDQSIEIPSDGVLYINFTTAGSPPYEYLEKLAQVCIAERCDMSGAFYLELIRKGRFFVDANNEFCIESQDLEY